MGGGGVIALRDTTAACEGWTGGVGQELTGNEWTDDALFDVKIGAEGSGLAAVESDGGQV